MLVFRKVFTILLKLVLWVYVTPVPPALVWPSSCSGVGLANGYQ